MKKSEVTGLVLGGLIASIISARAAKKREQENKEFEEKIKKDAERLVYNACMERYKTDHIINDEERR